MNLLAEAAPTLGSLVLMVLATLLVGHALWACHALVKWLRANDHGTAADVVEDDLEPIVEVLVEAFQKTHQGDPEHPAAENVISVASETPGALDHPAIMRALDGPPPMPLPVVRPKD